ncbi:hypothetical protein V8C86DRAFT_2514678 [Haematococcus lacustris]
MPHSHSLPSLMSIAVLVCVLACATASGHRHQNRGHIAGSRRLSQAVAIANAVANSNGGNAVVNSNAGAVSTGGKPALSVSDGRATAGPGQSVRVDCNSYAVNSVDYKRCTEGGQTPASSPTPTAPAPVQLPPGVTWENAPACNPSAPGASCSSKDQLGRCWGFQNNRSCAYKDGAGAAIPATAIGTATAAAAAGAPVPSPAAAVAKAAATAVSGSPARP